MCRSGFTNPPTRKAWEVVELINTPKQEGPSSYRRDRRQPKAAKKLKGMKCRLGAAVPKEGMLVCELQHFHQIW